MKKCNQCGVLLTEKNAARKNKTQWRGICKKCRVRSVCEYQKNNKEKVNKINERCRRKKGIGREYPCLVCGKPQKRIGAPHVCSEKCRLYFYIKKVGDCWLWTGAKGRRGYGKMMANGKTCVASRESYKIFKGPIPENKFICHTCDMPACVNPAHLWVGTPKQNAEDMVKKNRQSKNTKPAAKLSWEAVKEIKDLRSRGMIMKDIAILYRIKPSAIQAILAGKTWVKK